MHVLTTDHRRLAALRWLTGVVIGVVVVALVVGQLLSMPTQPMVEACANGCDGPNYGSLGVAATIPAAVAATYAIRRRE